jgi:hypothetical protein
MFGLAVGVIETGGRETKAAQSARTPKPRGLAMRLARSTVFVFGSLVYAQTCEDARRRNEGRRIAALQDARARLWLRLES